MDNRVVIPGSDPDMSASGGIQCLLINKDRQDIQEKISVIRFYRFLSAVQLWNTKDTKNLKNTKTKANKSNIRRSVNLKHWTTQKSTEDTEMTRTQALPLHSPQNQRHCERSEAIRKDSLAIMGLWKWFTGYYCDYSYLNVGWASAHHRRFSGVILNEVKNLILSCW